MCGCVVIFNTSVSIQCGLGTMNHRGANCDLNASRAVHLVEKTDKGVFEDIKISGVFN